MSESRRELPSMTALACFVAAAREGGFSRAGEQLGLTQSAVSRQIALLEETLQTTLFQRHGRRVILNEAGRAYAEDIEPALRRIRMATVKAMDRGNRRDLSIATLPSFGMRWLAPRLPGLTARYPELTVNYAARSFPFDLREERFDAAIHFGAADWADAEMVPLFTEQAVVACSPTWLAAEGVNEPKDLLDKPLLFQISRRQAWNRWFALAGLDGLPPLKGATFEHFLMLAQAAAAGSGAALLPRFLIEPELQSGVLVTPFSTALVDEGQYYLVLRPDWRDHPGLVKFHDWLVDVAKEQGDA
jgi:DNA-binding transcriptional LysR family regulator